MSLQDGRENPSPAPAPSPTAPPRSTDNTELSVDRPARRRRQRVVETPEYGEFATRVVVAYARRVAEKDIAGLAGLAGLRDVVDDALQLAVANLHEHYSWTEIADALGVSRQAARQKYGRKIA